MSAPRPHEAGYAVLAAMVAAAGFALVAAQLVATSRTAVITASAEAVRARMSADVQAGFALAADGLIAADPKARWSIGGEPRTLDFDDAVLTIRVEDERGKIPLNTISATQARAMFQLAGADPAVADNLATAFLFRRDPTLRLLNDDDDEPGTHPPAPAPPRSPAGRGLGLATVRDLLLLPGMTADIYAALAPSVSLAVRDAAFEPRTATPLSLEVMTGAAAASPAVIERRRELEGETTALDTAPPLALAGRPLTLRVQVRDARGDSFERAQVVELTRSAERPYVVRGLNE